MSHPVTHALVTFRDGPVEGKGLTLGRWPRFLRVEIAPDGHVDALDQPEDLPQLGATLHVYEQIPGTTGHICTRGQGCYPTIDYRVSDAVEPTDDWEEWGRRVTTWCDAEAAAKAAPLHAVAD